MTEKNIRSQTNYEEALNEYKLFLEITNKTVNEMRVDFLQFPPEAKKQLLSLYWKNFFLNWPPFFLTRAEKLLASTPHKLYHVTGCSAITSLISGESLRPCTEWNLYNLRSDKGLGPSLQHYLLHAMRINDALVNFFLFSGAKVDAEQVWSLQRNAGTKVNADLAGIFFGPNALIMQILRFKKDGDIKSENYKNLSEAFLKQMYDSFFLREGWLEEVKKWLESDGALSGIFEQTIVNGEIDLKEIADWSGFRYDVKKQPNLNSEAEQAAILELDLKKLIKANKIGDFILLPGGARNLNEIFPSQTIPLEAVTGVFVDDPTRFNFKLPFEVLPFSNLPGDKWLGNLPYTDNMWPDMNNPLCALRYTEKNPRSLETLLTEGLAVPLRPLDPRVVFKVLPNSIHQDSRRTLYTYYSDEMSDMPGFLDEEFLHEMGAFL
jgi:hypothetical protein